MEESKAEGAPSQTDAITKAIGDFGNMMSGMAKQIQDKDATISEQSKKIQNLEALAKVQKEEINRYKKMVHDMQNSTEDKLSSVEEIKEDANASIDQIIDKSNEEEIDRLENIIRGATKVVHVNESAENEADKEAEKPAEQQEITVKEEDKPREQAAESTEPEGSENNTTQQSEGNAEASTEVDREICEVDEQALEDELESVGPFEFMDDGKLAPEDMLKLKRVICKFSYLSFVDCKQKMMEERIGYLKDEQEHKYQMMIQRAAARYTQLQLDVTRMAADYIELEEVYYEASMKEILKNPETLQQMKKDDESVRMSLEQPNVLSKEKAKELAILKIKMELETLERLAPVQVKSQEQ